MEDMPEPIIEATRGEFQLSSDRTKIKLDQVHAFLSQSYWSPGLPTETLNRAIAGSICLGVYWHDQQVGFARVISDRATFAYLCDVYVLPDYRGKGLAKWMMESIVSHPSLQGLRRFSLVTRDAHGLYCQFGFTPIANPESFMEIVHKDIYLRN